MSGPYTVSLGKLFEPRALQHRSALASLPNHFTLVEGGAADAALVTDPDAESGTTRAIVLDGAALLDPPRPEGRIVLPAFRFLPRLMADPCFARMRGSTFALIEMATTVVDADTSSLSLALVEQLAILDAVVGVAPRNLKLRRTGRGYSGVATQDAVAFSATQSAASSPSLTLSAVSVQERLEVWMEDDVVARPADIRLFDHEGSDAGWPVYQNALRMVWLDAFASLKGGTPDLLCDSTRLARLARSVTVALGSATCG